MNNQIKTNRSTFVLGIMVTVIIGFFLIRKVSEYDIWYHMAMGKEILRNGGLPVSDQLSLLNYGADIHAHLWLFQTISAAGYSVIGYWWLHTLQISIWGGILWYVYRLTRLHVSAKHAWLLLLVTAMACSERFTIRPEIVSYLVLIIFYWKLQQGEHFSFAEYAMFFVLQEVWTNSHGLFVIGPFLVACYLLEALKDAWINKSYDKVRSLGILLCVVITACIVTPIGFENIKYTWLLMVEASPASAKLFKNIFEMAAPLGDISRQQLPFWFFLPLFAGFLITLLQMFIFHRREIPIARTVIVSSMLILSMTGIRNMPLFAIIAAPIIVEYMSLLGSKYIRNTCKVAVFIIVLVSGIVWSPRPALNFLVYWVPYRFGVGLSPEYVPIGLPAFLDKVGFSGNIYNSQVLGGFYEYYGAPERIPFFDYRLEDYDPYVLQQIYDAVSQAHVKPTAWNELVRRYDFRGILLEHSRGAIESEGLLPYVTSNLGWRLVFFDHAASFWLREDFARMAPEVNNNMASDIVKNVTNMYQAENIDFFLERTGKFPELRLELLEHSVQRWGRPLFIAKLGLLKMQLGDTVRAEQLFSQLLNKEPKSRETLTTLAQIALNRGDARTAEMYLRKAISYFPDDPDLRQNLVEVLNSAKR